MFLANIMRDYRKKRLSGWTAVPYVGIGQSENAREWEREKVKT